MPDRTGPRPAGTPKTVLVVDDDSVVRAVAARIVEHLGYVSLAASNVPEAMEVFEAAPAVDGVITDMVMPGGNGMVLVRWLRERRPDLPILVMSGYIPDDVLVEDVPHVRVLHKPVRLEEFAAELAATVGPPVDGAG